MFNICNMSDIPQNLFERLSTRYCWNKIKIPEYDIIEWIKTLTPDELVTQIECTKAMNNNILIAVETLSFDVADYIYNFNKSYATPNIFWYIMIHSYNQNIEEKNPELFIKACDLFCKILDDYDIEKICIGSIIHISVRFNTILFTKKLVEKGLSLKHYYQGITPLLELVKHTIHNKFNKEMFDYILLNGSSVDEITKHTDIKFKKITYVDSYCGFLINKTPGLSLKDSIHKNVLEIITMSYDILLKYEILIENPEHPIYNIMKYFDILIKLNNYECNVCMTEGDIILEKLHCSHHICINCAIEIQKDNKIICPFCRRINDYSDNPYLVKLLITNIGEIKIKKETTMKQLIKICQDKIGYKYIVLRVDNKIISNTNQSLKEMGIKNNSSIYCNIRIANQLTSIELEEWSSSGLSLNLNGPQLAGNIFNS